jgi:hypothetical protein
MGKGRVVEFSLKYGERIQRRCEAQQTFMRRPTGWIRSAGEPLTCTIPFPGFTCATATAVFCPSSIQERKETNKMRESGGGDQNKSGRKKGSTIFHVFNQ